MTATIHRLAGRGLRITALEVRNLWGIAEAVIRPGQRNIIRGANGTGKSSLLKAIQLALGGGTLGKYQRIGAEDEPEIVLEISGPSDFIRVEREGDKPPRVLRRVGDSEALEKVPAPATFLKGLFDVEGANPFAFLLASDDQRAQLLLEALDLKMDEAALQEVLGEDEKLAGAIPTTLHPLVRLSLIHDSIYSARRGVNVDAESKAKAAEQLRRSVPHERIPDLADQIARLEADVNERAETWARRAEANERTAAREIDEANAASSAEAERLRAALDAEIAHRRADLASWAASRRAEVEREISVRESELAESFDVSRSRVQSLIDRERADADAAIEFANLERARLAKEIEAGSQAVATDRTRLAQLRERQRQAEADENTRLQIRAFDHGAEVSRENSARLSLILAGLERLKRKLAERLPIPGLDISGKEIRVNGVPWRDLNNAQQGTIAGIVAVERAKRSRLPVVFFDEAERFDDEHLDAIAKVVEEADAQLFAAVVAREGELSVEADGEAAGLVDLGAPPDPTVQETR